MTDARQSSAPAVPVRLAVLGCGRVAQLLHLPALRTVNDVRVEVLAEPNAANLAAASASFPEAATEADWREALRRDDVDAAVICLPTHLHADAAVAALEAGKHVYIEKPVAVDVHGARRLVEAERASGLVAMSGFNFRFHPAFVSLRQRLLAGEVGEVVGVRTIFTVPPRALPSWKVDRKTGGGAMLDQFSHHADLLRFLLDGVTDARPIRVTADVRSVLSDADTAAVTTRLAGGVLMQSMLSLSTAEQDRVEVLGTAGRAVADRLRLQCWSEAAGGGYTRPDRVARVVESTTRALGLVKNVVRPKGKTGHAAALAEFAAAVHAGRTASVTLADGVRSLAWVLAAERAAEKGEVVEVDAESLGLDPEPAPHAKVANDPPPARELPPVEFPQPGDDRPLASVVLVASTVDESIRHVVRCIRRQTLAGRLEFIVVAATREQIDDLTRLDGDEVETLGWVTRVVLGRPVVDVDAESADGIRRARGPVTCVVEDHAYPLPDWVEKLLTPYQAAESRVGAAGSTVLNANPDSALSWTNLLIAYGTWLEPIAAGETLVGNHNVSFRTDAVAPYGESLARRLTRGGSIMDDLRRRGFDVLLAPGARVYHANPSKLTSTLKLRFDGGRLYAASKANAERWPVWRRGVYAALSPAIAVIRWGMLKHKFGPAGRRSLPAVALGLTLDAIGQGAGFALGSGGTPTRLRDFEIGRARHLNRRDRVRMNDRRLTFSTPKVPQAGAGTT